MSGALFDMPGIPDVQHPTEVTETLSPDQKRTRRQYELLLAGQHPLTLVTSRPLRLHEEAAPADDRHADGLRCGTCEFREVFGRGSRDYPKCTFGGGTRINHSASSDVRRWWSACLDYQPADGDQ